MVEARPYGRASDRWVKVLEALGVTPRRYVVCLNSLQWWAAVDSNHLPPRYQHGALPVELAAQFQQGYSPERNRANRNSTMGTNRPCAAFGSRPVSPRRWSCSGASSATATLGGNAPICRHSSATGLSSSHRPCTRSACKVG